MSLQNKEKQIIDPGTIVGQVQVLYLVYSRLHLISTYLFIYRKNNNKNDGDSNESKVHI